MQAALRVLAGECPGEWLPELGVALTERGDALLQLLEAGVVVRRQQVIDTHTSAWGVKVTSVEVRDLKLPQSMQRPMARQAEAEREKRAKVIDGEGESSASQQLANAAQVIGSQPATRQLHYL